jgi:AcrR family transcriptional regulator
MDAHPNMPAARSVGRPREFDMDEALDAASRVFRERGYHATSIADLRAAMHLTAGSLYKAFKDKRAIFVAVLDRYIASRDAALAGWLASARTGREKVLAALRSYAEVSHDAEGRRGCLIVGGLSGIDTFDEPLAQRFRQSLSRLERLFAGFVEQGIRDGSLPARLDPQASARYLLCVVEGLRVLGKRGAGEDEVEAIVAQAMQALA